MGHQRHSLLERARDYVDAATASTSAEHLTSDEHAQLLQVMSIIVINIIVFFFNPLSWKIQPKTGLLISSCINSVVFHEWWMISETCETARIIYFLWARDFYQPCKRNWDSWGDKISVKHVIFEEPFTTPLTCHTTPLFPHSQPIDNLTTLAFNYILGYWPSIESDTSCWALLARYLGDELVATRMLWSNHEVTELLHKILGHVLCRTLDKCYRPQSLLPAVPDGDIPSQL